MNTQKNAPVRRLLPKMALAQAIITVAVVLANVAIYLAQEAEEATDSRVALVARQCAIAQEITKSALLFVESGNQDFAKEFSASSDAHSRYQTELSTTLDEWTANQLTLQSLTREFSPSNDDLGKLLDEVQPSFWRIKVAAKHISESRESSDKRSVNKELAVILSTERSYRSSMAAVSAAIQEECQRTRYLFETSRGISSGLILLTILGVGKFIFRPLAKDLGQAFQVLEEDAERLEEHSAEIMSLQEELEAQNAHLTASETKAIAEASKATANLQIAERAGRRFQELFEGLPVACFTVDREGRIHEWNRASEELFQLPGHMVFLQRVSDVLPGFYGDYGPEIICEIDQALLSNEAFEQTRKFAMQSGEERWVLSNAFPFHDVDGKVVGALCACFDITSRKRSEEQSQLAEERIRGVVEAAGDAIITIDSGGAIRTFNPAAESIFGHSVGDVLGQNVSILVPELDESKHECGVQESLEEPTNTQPGVSVRELTGVRKDGSEFPIELSLSKGYAGGDVFFTCILRDITERRRMEIQISEQSVRVNDMLIQLELQTFELEEANKKLSTLATTDGLTGLQNHRAFRELLSEHFQKAKEGEPLSLLLLDIDHFKNFNDEFGHQAGDHVLRMVAEAVSMAVRDKGYTARYGGEEFAVLLPGFNSSAAKAKAEKIRRFVEQISCDYRGVTVSIGIATFGSEVKRPDILVERSDQALYASKRAGRNRVTAWNVSLAEAA